MQSCRILRWPVVAVVLATSGCVKPYPDMRLVSSVRVTDLDAELTDETEGIQVYDNTTTVGLFPTGVAVVRVNTLDHTPPDLFVENGTHSPASDDAVETRLTQGPPAPDDTATRDVPVLAGFKPGAPTAESSPPQEYVLFPLRSFAATYWMELFDSTTDVREVILLHDKSVRRKVTTLGELLHVAEVLHCGVVLVYGFDNSSEYDTCRVVGLVYESHSGRLIARIQHTGTIDDSVRAALELRHGERPERELDWSFYTDEVAFRSFEAKLRQVVWDMIDRDMPAGGQSPNPYESFEPRYKGGVLWIDPGKQR